MLVTAISMIDEAKDMIGSLILIQSISPIAFSTLVDAAN